MDKECAIREIKYRLSKYIFRILVKEGLLSSQQYLLFRDQLIDEYQPVIGSLERGICEYLNSRQVPTPSAKGSWCKNVIVHILSNEKYKGDARLQKTFTVDYLTKKMKKNEGELPQYYVEKGHTPIISDEIFELVQKEHARRISRSGQYSSKHPLSAKLICAGCGGYYGRRVRRNYGY